jgi:NAD(P)-dependent dehydrogenase (short-subunit alcohol dehydrogenase family)
VDVTSKASLAAAVQHIRQKSDYVNLVIANAGIQGPTLGGLPGDASLLELQDYLQNWNIEEFNKTYEVNTTAVFSTLVAFLELLDRGNKKGNVEQKSQFIAISSAGAYSRVPMAGFAYAGSKAATIHMMKQFATKLVPYAIRANVIAPGCKSTRRGTCIPDIHRSSPSA